MAKYLDINGLRKLIQLIKRDYTNKTEYGVTKDNVKY